MKKKLQVFVSSTFTDMQAERQAAVEAILRAGHIPAGMELFAAGDRSQLDVIRTWIDESDVFMLILGGRYGSIEKESGKSYIHLEYEYAVEHGKPLFAAVMSEKFLNMKVKSKLGKSALEDSNPSLLKSFRTTVMSRICREFGSTTDLKVIVFESLGDHARNSDLAGWVRGSEVVDPKATFEEIDRLRVENLKLQAEVVVARASAAPEFEGATLHEVAMTLASEVISIHPRNPANELVASLIAKGGKSGQVSALRLFTHYITLFLNGFVSSGNDTLIQYTLSNEVCEILLRFGMLDTKQAQFSVYYTINSSGRTFYNLIKSRVEEFDPIPVPAKT